MRTALLTLCVATAGCDQVFVLPHVPTVDAATAPIAGVAFGQPVRIAGVQTSMEEDDPSLTADMLELYLLRNSELQVATRATVDDPFSPATPIAELNTTLIELRPSVSANGLTIYFARRTDSLPRHDDIYVSTRIARTDAWRPATPVQGDINTTNNEVGGWSSADGLQLLVEADTAVGGQRDLFIATRPTRDAGFTRGAWFDAINSPSNDGNGWFNSAGTIFVFESNRGSGSMAVWEAVRDGDAWTLVSHPELDSPASDGTPWLSPDGRTIVFSSSRNGTDDDLYIATR